MTDSAQNQQSFTRPGHIGEVVVPLDGRRPYVNIHPTFQSAAGEPRTEQEHTVKQALARVLYGKPVDGDRFIARRFGVAWQFNTDQETAA